MEPAPGGPGWGEGPYFSASSGHRHGPGPPSSAVSSTVATTSSDVLRPPPAAQQPQRAPPSRYESQKRRDWNTFLQYLRNHKPPLSLARCSGAHVIEFLKYLDQFGKTKVHTPGCLFFGQPNPPSPCVCPLRQAWGSLDALVGRLRAAYEENEGKPESNPFGARAVRFFLREIRESQAKARGIPYEKKKRKRIPPGASSSSASAVVGTGDSSSTATLPAGTKGTVGGEGSGAPPPVPPHP